MTRAFLSIKIRLNISHQTNDFAEDGHVVEDKIFHVIVFGVKNKFAVALVKALDRGAVVDEGDNDFAVFGDGLFFDDNFIAAEHAYLFH